MIPDANSDRPLDMLVSTIADRLQEQIERGTLPVGSWIRQQVVAQEFQVSRTPVREALQQLQTLGFVDLIPHRGARVRGRSMRDILEAYHVRAELEGFAAELAAGLITEGQIERLRDAEALFGRAVETMAKRRRLRLATEDPPNSTPWVQANNEFHEVVQEAACNEKLREVIRLLHISIPRSLTWLALNDDLRLLEQNVTQHRSIREAIEGRNAAEARALMVEHVRRAGDLVALRSTRLSDVQDAIHSE
jgi:DNA-binding GntR family transcriptional regulator